MIGVGCGDQSSAVVTRHQWPNDADMSLPKQRIVCCIVRIVKSYLYRQLLLLGPAEQASGQSAPYATLEKLKQTGYH